MDTECELAITELRRMADKFDSLPARLTMPLPAESAWKAAAQRLRDRADLLDGGDV